MRIDFYEPPAEQKKGGLEQAIVCLREYLQREGCEVQLNPSHEAAGATPDVVHLHGLWQPPFQKISKWCRRRSVPYVVSPHGMLEPWAWRHKRWKKLPYYYLFERALLHNAAAVLATSEQEQQNLARFVPSQRVSVIPLGLTDNKRPDYAAARQALGWADDEFIFLYFSRIHPKKGLHILISALAECVSGLPRKWRLVIVGSGDEGYVTECKNRSRANNAVSSRTEWRGAVWGDAKWPFFQGADLFCLPSFSENFGLAILEALQVGTRVLTTRETPWSFVPSLGAGVITDPEAGPVQRGIMEVLAARAWDIECRRDLANKIQDRFGWQTIGGRYLQLYHRLAGSTAAPNISAVAC